jgi:hypothetical protein
VGRLAAIGVCTGLVCMAAGATVDAAPRGGFFTPGNAPRAPEIMLYFSHSVGAGAGAGSMRPNFGLKVQQVRQAANSGDPESGDPMQHRELINWQMDGHSNLRLSDMRVKLGNKLTYDVASHRFGAPSGRSAMQLGIPSIRNGVTPFSAPLRGLAARNSNDSIGAAPGARNVAPVARDVNRDNSAFREVAIAAMAAVTPARFTNAQRQIAQRQGGLTAVVAGQRMQGAATLR